MAVNISGAAARLLTVAVDGYAPGRNKPGYCLRWNYFAAGITPNISPASAAMDAWNYAPAQHRHPITASTVIPADVPIILGPSPTRTDAARNAGDVVLPHGGSGFAVPVNATDSLAGAGHIGTMTLAQRAAQTQRPVLGYLTWWLGYELDVASSAPTTPTPTPSEEDDMEPIIGIKGGPHNGAIVMLDQGQRTYWNIAKGCANVADAMTRLGVWESMGHKYYPDQSPLLIAGFTDITDLVETTTKAA